MDLCDRRTIEELLTRHGFRFAKYMGQNFLIEGWVPRDTAEVCGADENCGKRLTKHVRSCVRHWTNCMTLS